MRPARRSLLLPAMLAVLVAVFFAALFVERWVATRVRPARPDAAEAAREAAASEDAPGAATSTGTGVRASPAADDASRAPAALRRCLGDGAPVYTSGACPPGTRLEREIEVAAMRGESAELRRARERCETGRLRARVELAKLGARRVAGDTRLWDDYAVRECAAYTAMVR